MSTGQSRGTPAGRFDRKPDWLADPRSEHFQSQAAFALASEKRSFSEATDT
jgi:hypothetical protein